MRYKSAKMKWGQLFKNCGTGAGGFQSGNNCARGGGDGVKLAEVFVASDLFSEDVIKEVSDNFLTIDEAKEIADEGATHDDWQLYDDLSDKAKKEIKSGGLVLQVKKQTEDFGNGQKLRLYNSTDKDTKDLKGVFFAFDESVSAEYAAKRDYTILRKLDVTIPQSKIASEVDLQSAAELVLGNVSDWAFESADNKKVQDYLRSKGFLAVKFMDVTPNNNTEHETILFLQNP